MPTVSVIVPAYNQSRFLGAALTSALSQTYRDLEVVVVDDGSTDDTAEVVRRTDDHRVHYVYQHNQGLSAARNTGIRHARGWFLTFLDADDEFLPGKLEILLDAFHREPSLGFVAGYATLIDERGDSLGETFERAIPFDTSELLLGNPLHVGSVMVRREWQDRVGPFDESLRSYEDWDMWLRLALAGCRMRSVPTLVSRYRFHGAQMTRVGAQMTAATFAVLEKTFRDPSALPAPWRARRDEAYSRAHLRAAAQAYTARDFAHAKQCLTEAVRLNPSLAERDAEVVAGLAAGWANHAKTRDPLTFLASVYDALPDELGALRRRRGRELARQSLQLGFAALHAGDTTLARTRLWQAVKYRPGTLLARGVVRGLVRTTFGALAPSSGRRRVRRAS